MVAVACLVSACSKYLVPVTLLRIRFYQAAEPLPPSLAFGFVLIPFRANEQGEVRLGMGP